MGVVIWYQIAFDGLGIKVSNDVASGSYIVDAEITVNYSIGQPGSFTATLQDLPMRITDAVTTALLAAPPDRGGGVTTTIKLGYFDGAQETVLKGRIETVDSRVRENRLMTTLKGREEAAFKLCNSPGRGVRPNPSLEGERTAEQVVTEIANLADMKPETPVTSLDASFNNLHLEEDNAFDLLTEFAGKADAEVLVEDGKLFFGTALAYSPGAGLQTGPPTAPRPSALKELLTGEDRLIFLSPTDSAPLASFQPLTRNIYGPGPVASDRPQQKSVSAFDFITTGLPSMRAGQLVVAAVSGYQDPFKPFRIADLSHSYSISGGYTCSGRAVLFIAGGSNRQQTYAGRDASAQSVADILKSRTRRSQELYPSIDVGRVKGSSFKPKERLATVYYRQEFAPDKPSPSIDVDIPAEGAPLIDKPLASPFAFHNVGLIVPVYDGMRALLAQNRSVRQDAVLAGFLWANEPRMERPQANARDWWLALPTDIDGKGLPFGKGVNDLVDGHGLRVIEVKSLRLVVGEKNLKEVGKRPQLGKNDELLIEHDSGTTIKISSGGDVEIKGHTKIKLVAGGVSLTIGSGKVQIANEADGAG